MTFLIVVVASVTLGSLIMAPPTIMIVAPASIACDTVSEFRPPATAMGMFTALERALSSSSGVLAIICSSMLT